MNAPERLVDLLPWQLAKKPLPDCLAANENGQWRRYSTQEVKRLADAASRGLLALGVQPGDRVAIVSDNCPEWNLADLGALQIGAVSVPIFPTLTAGNYHYILQHSGAKVVFVQRPEFLEKVLAQRTELPDLQHIVGFKPLPGTMAWNDFQVHDPGVAIEDYTARIQPQDLATIVYTSGTTGVPKGVMLSHRNLISNITTVADCGLLPNEELILRSPNFRALSFLPLSHVFERAVIYAYWYKCIPAYYATSIDTIRDDFQSVQPYVFSAVPRLLEKLYEAIVKKGNELSGAKKKLFFWALDLVQDYEPFKTYPLSYRLKLAVARKLIFSKWQAAMGGNVAGIITGSAKLAPKYMHVFWGAGIPIVEAYGMSETSPAITANRLAPGQIRIGSVGKVIPGVEAKILPEAGYPQGEGEIVARGPNVMLGYYKMPEATAEAIDAEGWMHTGDIGRFDAQGFLFITDRKKEIFKTSQGKYIAPQNIENLLKESRFVEQIMVVGENQRYAAALIVPSFANLTDWALENGLPKLGPHELVEHPRVLRLMQDEVDRLNPRLDRHEQLKRFALLPAEWTTEAGELTPTLKVMRRVISQKYAPIIHGLFVE